MGFSLSFFKKKQINHIYFGLYFTESRISGIAFDIVAGKSNILSENSYEVTAGFEKILEDIDNLISDLELKTNLTLDKTIFFLHTSMLDPATKDIKEPYKEMLKKISKELELEPMGYIDVHEAVEGQMKENSVINNILLEISPKEISVFVYKGGTLATSTSTERTEAIAEDLRSALEALPKKVMLPSKITMYGVGNLIQYSSDISTYKWDESIFPHHPTLEVLKDASFDQILADTFVDELLSKSEESVDPDPEAPQANTSPVEETVSTQFGFMIGQDVKNSQQSLTPEKINDQVSGFMSRMTSHFASSDEQPQSPRDKKKILAKPQLVIAIIVGTGIVLGSFFSFEYFVHAATIEVEVQTADLSKKINLSLPIVEKSSPSDLSVIKHVKVIEYADEKNTTGKRDVGEKAKGNVIIHNFDNSERKLERGTELSYKNMKFILDSDVKVASSSGISSDGVKQSGKAKASLTAAEIGSEYNISKGAQLSIGSLSDSLYVAIVDSDFSGGSKKQVTTISKADMDQLMETVEDEVKKKSKDEVSKLIAKDELLIPELTTISVADSEYSGEVGEEANIIKIKASSEIEYYTFEKEKLIKELYTRLEKEKKDSYVVDKDSVIYKIGDIEESDDKESVDMTIQVSAKQYEQLNDNEIKEKITLKSASKVDSILKAAYDIEAATVKKATPSFPWLPLFTKNITIETEAK